MVIGVQPELHIPAPNLKLDRFSPKSGTYLEDAIETLTKAILSLKDRIDFLIQRNINLSAEPVPRRDQNPRRDQWSADSVGAGQALAHPSDNSQERPISSTPYRYSNPPPGPREYNANDSHGKGQYSRARAERPRVVCKTKTKERKKPVGFFIWSTSVSTKTEYKLDSC